MTHKWKDQLDRSLSGLRFGEDMRGAVRARALPAAGAARPRRRLTGRAAAALAVCAALIVTALAAGSALWETIRADLGLKAPYATAATAAAVEQGLRLEVQTALFDNRTAKLYFTMQDLEGDRLDGDTALFFDLDNPQEEGNTEMPWHSARVEQLSYDPASKTASYALTITGWSTRNTRPIRLTVEELSPGRRAAEDWVALEGMTAEPAPWETTEDGHTVLTPDPARLAGLEALAPEDRPAYAITAAGFAGDGRLHLRVRTPQAPPVWSAVEAMVMIQDVEGQGAYVGRWENVTAVAVEDGTDYRFDAYTAEDLPRMIMLEVRGAYSVKSAPITGAWSVEVPFRGIESREIVLPDGVRVPTVRPEEDSLKADRLVLSPLSLTLYCSDFYSGNMLKAPVRYEELELKVTLADGTSARPP